MLGIGLGSVLGWGLGVGRGVKNLCSKTMVFKNLFKKQGLKKLFKKGVKNLS